MRRAPALCDLRPARRRGVAYDETRHTPHLPDAPQDVFLIIISDLRGVLFKRLKSLELEPSISMLPHDLALRRYDTNTGAFFDLTADLLRPSSSSLSKNHQANEISRQLEALKAQNEVTRACNPLSDSRISLDHVVRSPSESASQRSSFLAPTMFSKSCSIR